MLFTINTEKMYGIFVERTIFPTFQEILQTSLISLCYLFMLDPAKVKHKLSENESAAALQIAKKVYSSTGSLISIIKL